MMMNANQRTHGGGGGGGGGGGDATKFEHDARRVLSRAVEVLDALGIRFWINSGTLLGWLRQCGFIGHARDVDIGVFAQDFRSELIPARSLFVDKQKQSFCSALALEECYWVKS
jgi:hypothetical protein